MKLGNANPTIIDFDPFLTATNQTLELGASIDISDGRRFRYSSCGSALTGGQVAQAQATKTGHSGLVVSLNTVYPSAVVTLTNGTTPIVASEYTEGFLSMNTGVATGATFKISDNQATAASAAGNVTLFDVYPNPAIQTGAVVSLIYHARKLTAAAAVNNRRLSGSTLVAVPALSFYWGQTHGICTLTADANAIVQGSTLVCSTLTAGSVTQQSATFATAQTTVTVGMSSYNAVAPSAAFPAFLTID